MNNKTPIWKNYEELNEKDDNDWNLFKKIGTQRHATLDRHGFLSLFDKIYNPWFFLCKD